MICEGHQGDCRLWNTYDKDHDGIMSPKELENYVAHDQNTRRTYLKEKTLKELRKAEIQFEIDCHRKPDGIPKTDGPTNKVFLVKYELSKKIQSGISSLFARKENLGIKSLPVKSFDSIAEVEKYHRSLYPAWPRRCDGGSDDGYEKHDCRVEFDAFEKEVSCQSNSEKPGLRVPFTKGAFHPEIRDMALNSRRCQKVWAIERLKNNLNFLGID